MAEYVRSPHGIISRPIDVVGVEPDPQTILGDRSGIASSSTFYSSLLPLAALVHAIEDLGGLRQSDAPYRFGPVRNACFWEFSVLFDQD